VSVREEKDVVVLPAFVSLMTHELAQPLAAALGSTYTLKEQKDSGQLDEATRDLLCNTTIRNLEQLQSLLDNLRIFSEAEAGILRVHPSPVSIDDLFRDAEDDFTSLWPHRRVAFLREPGLQVEVDITLFRQVLTNLINNAVKFSPTDSLVRIEARRASDDEVVIAVADEGEGFPPKEAEHIFERAVRLHEGKKGMGVGLFVSRAIAESHGGRIWAENTDSGARFSVAVPAA
jgi:signal transduction histidine kinase